MGAGGGEERKPEAEELGAGGELCTLHPPSWLPQARSRGRARPPPVFFLWFSITISHVSSFVISLVRSISSWDRPGRRAKGSLQRADSGREAQTESAPPQSRKAVHMRV